MLNDATIKQIKLLVLDVDGVLTDGKIIYSDNGREIKQFNVKDGLGIRLLMDAGIPVAILTARRSEALTVRCRDLGIEHVYAGVKNKAAELKKILAHFQVKLHETAFMGDDLPDLEVMRQVGFSAAPADASDTIREVADMITRANGGNGAVREVCERILQSKGAWQSILKRF